MCVRREVLSHETKVRFTLDIRMDQVWPWRHSIRLSMPYVLYTDGHRFYQILMAVKDSSKGP